MAGVKLSVTGQAELATLSTRLKAAGDKGLTRELRKGLQRAAKPAVDAAQDAARRIPIRGVRGGGTAARAAHHRIRYKRAARGGHGLRATVARAVRAQIRMGGNAALTIKTLARMMPASQRKLPRYLDSVRGWRHPFFGNREHWYQQRGEPWFGETLKRQGPTIRGEVLDAMARVAQQITRG
jgi:hypothetical protein